MTNADLSGAANLSPSACHRRVQRLEQEGIIGAYVALLDARKLGRPTTVFVEITLSGQADEVLLKKLVEDHHRWTGSLRARDILDQWSVSRAKFVKVIPHEYRRALAEQAAKAQASTATTKAKASAAAVAAK